MKTYIALLRGINVSGKNQIRMEELKARMLEINLENVRTYIQSGNLIFNHIGSSHTEFESMIADKIATDFGFNVPVMVKTAVEIDEAIENNPFISTYLSHIDKLHITFLSGIPEENSVSELLAVTDPSDKFIISGDTVYLYCPNGYGSTMFSNTFFEKKLKRTATTRNWKTMLKLAEMMKE